METDFCLFSLKMPLQFLFSPQTGIFYNILGNGEILAFVIWALCFGHGRNKLHGSLRVTFS